MARLSWLHLADLCMTRAGSRLLTPEVREEFERDLRLLHQRTGPWELVLISGGLTLQGRSVEFKTLELALESLLDFLHSLGSTPELVPIPSKNDFWNLSFKSNSQYIKWLHGWHARHPPKALQLHKAITSEQFHALVHRGPLRIRILGMAFPEELPVLDAREQDFSLLLTPLPPSQPALLEKQERLLCLCGDRVSTPTFVEGARTLEDSHLFQVRSLFGDFPGTPDEVENWGYAVGHLEGESKVERIRIFPRRVTLAKSGRMNFVADDSFELDSDECIQWPHRPSSAATPNIVVPERPPPPEPQTPGLKRTRTLKANSKHPSWLAWHPSGKGLVVGSSEGRI